MDIVAAVCEILGCKYLGDKDKNGFVLNGIGCAVWVVVALKTQLWGLLIVAAIQIVINWDNYMKWKQQEGL